MNLRSFQGSCVRLIIRSANSPTFFVFSTSPTRKRTLKAFSTATIREMWVSESHSGTSLALMAGVSTTGSRNTVSKMACILAMTSAWFISAADVLDFGRHGLERFQPQFKFPFRCRFGGQSKTHPTVKITHHLVLGRGQVKAFEPRAIF